MIPVLVRFPRWLEKEISTIRGTKLRCTTIRALCIEALEARAKKNGQPWPPASCEK